MLDEFQLVISPMKGEERTVSLSDLEDAGLLTINTEDNGKIHFTIKGLSKYDLDGSMLSYSVKRVSEDGEDEDKFTPDGIGLDAEDNEYFDISYDNAGVPNHGTDKDQVYSGGSITLTLTGTTEYNAEKQWLDDGETDGRSEVTFQLWRYRLESGKTDQFKTAAPVRDASGNFVYMTVDGKTADEDGNLLTKTKLDKYDKEGYEYVYVVVETESEGGTTAYEKIFGTGGNTILQAEPLRSPIRSRPDRERSKKLSMKKTARDRERIPIELPAIATSMTAASFPTSAQTL